MNKLLLFLLIIACCSCTHHAETEITQSSRDNVVEVHDKVKAIDVFSTVLILLLNL